MAVTLVQSAGLDSNLIDDGVVLPAAPTPGNVLGLGLCVREGSGQVWTPSGPGWSLLARISTSGADNWPTAMYAKVVQPGDVAAINVVGANGQAVVCAAEFAGASAVPNVVATIDNSVGEASVVINPTAGIEAAILVFAGVRADGGPFAFTPVAGFTELYNSVSGLGPQCCFAYRIVNPAVGPYTAGETYGGGNQRAVVAAAFPGAAPAGRAIPPRYW